MQWLDGNFRRICLKKHKKKVQERVCVWLKGIIASGFEWLRVIGSSWQAWLSNVQPSSRSYDTLVYRKVLKALRRPIVVSSWGSQTAQNLDWKWGCNLVKELALYDGLVSRIGLYKGNIPVPSCKIQKKKEKKKNVTPEKLATLARIALSPRQTSNRISMVGILLVERRAARCAILSNIILYNRRSFSQRYYSKEFRPRQAYNEHSIDF